MWDRKKTYKEVNEDSDSYEELAVTAVNGKELCIYAEIEQHGLFGIIMAGMADIDKETGKKEVLYFYKKKFVSLDKSELEKKISDAAGFQGSLMISIAKGEA